MNLLLATSMTKFLGLLGWRRGELKWRSVKKAARRRGIDVSHVINLVLSSSLCSGVTRGHLGSTSEAGMLKEELLLQAAAKVSECLRGHRVTLVIDANLASREVLQRAARVIGASYARMGDSRVYLGIQLADIIAGACSEDALPPRGE